MIFMEHRLQCTDVITSDHFCVAGQSDTEIVTCSNAQSLLASRVKMLIEDQKTIVLLD